MVLDAVDIFLGHLYGLSPDVVSFILSFESEIRGGKQIPFVIERRLSEFLHTKETKEAINLEITKFRLWVWILDSSKSNSNLSLPDISYNIRKGNSLFGFSDIG